MTLIIVETLPGAIIGENHTAIKENQIPISEFLLKIR